METLNEKDINQIFDNGITTPRPIKIGSNRFKKYKKYRATGPFSSLRHIVTYNTFMLLFSYLTLWLIFFFFHYNKRGLSTFKWSCDRDYVLKKEIQITFIAYNQMLEKTSRVNGQNGEKIFWLLFGLSAKKLEIN